MENLAGSAGSCRSDAGFDFKATGGRPGSLKVFIEFSVSSCNKKRCLCVISDAGVGAGTRRGVGGGILMMTLVQLIQWVVSPNKLCTARNLPNRYC